MVVSSLLVSSFVLGIAGYFLPRLRRVLNNEREAAGIVSDILTELRGRLLVQDRKRTDMEVKLGLLDVKFDRLSIAGSRVRVTPVSGSSDVTSRSMSEPGPNPVPIRGFVDPRLTQTEQIIIELLTKNSLTPTQIRNAIGKSREHTSRMMKNLFEKGRVERNEVVRPFVYRLRSK